MSSRLLLLAAAAAVAGAAVLGVVHRPGDAAAPLRIEADARIALVGGNTCARMMLYGHFETETHLRFPDRRLVVRNLCDGGDTPGFRPHSGRPSPWAFPGAERFRPALARDSDSQGTFATPDEWLTRVGADVVVAFFGGAESFDGPEGVDRYRAELDAWVRHTLAQRYDGEAPPQVALVAPTAFEDLSDRHDLPDGVRENEHLALYAAATREVAEAHGLMFVDAFTASWRWYREADEPLTIDGLQFNDAGNARLADFLADALYDARPDPAAAAHRALVREAVEEKNWLWHNDYKIPNGVHVYGRRHEPFGPDNYPAELAKIRAMTAIRDTAVWHAARGERMDLAAADARTPALPAVETNYPDGVEGAPRYLYGDEALATFTTAPGYRIDLFASEREFPDLANPVQLSFDDAGRLWVAVMPSYPHWKPGDGRPDDKLLILEDTDGDGRADRQTVFADGLHLPVGFELAPEGVFVSQGTHLVLLTDTDGDDRADRREVVLSGFDDHDTHHTISAFAADPSGALYMGEGVFLHTNVETPYGPVRATNGGFYRYDPQRRRLERTAQLSIPNPWGTAFDAWGQPFFAETSGPDVRWMLPGTVRPLYGVATHKSFNLIEEAHLVRPTSGLEFVASRHFPDEVQGDLLINNTIGFLGTKQHRVIEDETGYRTAHRHDLVQSTDPKFRPVDMEFAPDGSLYLVDWHNVLVGHMQHNARDPLRDHVHGRIYRITYPSRPLVAPVTVEGAPVDALLEHLKLPEDRTRYRARRELRGRDADDVLPRLAAWVHALDPADPRYEHHMLEALWVTWGLNRVDAGLLRRLLEAEDPRVRAAAARVLRYAGDDLPDRNALLAAAARDAHGRVRMEAVAAASWLRPEEGHAVLDAAEERPLDRWLAPAFTAARAHLDGTAVAEVRERAAATRLEGDALALFEQGREIYARDGYCGTCHQADGGGLSASGFPPLAGTAWVTGDEERLIKLTLKGLHGPIEVLGETYGGQVPMTPFEGLLSDEEMAAVLTYVRNAFGNEAPVVAPEQVRAVRAALTDRRGFYTADELLREHPMTDE